MSNFDVPETDMIAMEYIADVVTDIHEVLSHAGVNESAIQEHLNSFSYETGKLIGKQRAPTRH